MAVEAESSERKSGGRSRSLLRRAGPALPYTIGGLVLVGYFVWMLLQMSTDAPGGGAVPVSIFGAVFLGVLAGAASVLSSRRRRNK
jgi:hypothetical protein